MLKVERFSTGAILKTRRIFLLLNKAANVETFRAKRHSDFNPLQNCILSNSLVMGIAFIEFVQALKPHSISFLCSFNRALRTIQRGSD